MSATTGGNATSLARTRYDAATVLRDSDGRSSDADGNIPMDFIVSTFFFMIPSNIVVEYI